MFAAGIATLGLVLNSPAVIIGAMLISPLMGSILASGVAFAAGDLILGLRAVGMLALSCLSAIAFSILLVSLMPFKEMTAEIAARTRPNSLDLAVALFSGAVGSLAICKEVKGVVTSNRWCCDCRCADAAAVCRWIWHWLCALSLDRVEGLRAAQGGGLLFLTNLVAITFTADPKASLITALARQSERSPYVVLFSDRARFTRRLIRVWCICLQAPRALGMAL